MAFFRRKKPSDAEIIDRVPVWRALSQVFIAEEKTPADYDEIAVRLAVSPVSEKDIRQILLGELYAPLYLNLFQDPLASWEHEFPDELLLDKLVPRVGRRPFPGPIVFFRRWMTEHLEEILTRFRRLRAAMAATPPAHPLRPNDDYIVGVVAKAGPTGEKVAPEARRMGRDTVTTEWKLSVPLLAWRRVHGPIEMGTLVVSDILSTWYFNDHVKRLQPEHAYLMRVRFRSDSTVELVALLDRVIPADAEIVQRAAEVPS